MTEHNPNDDGAPAADDPIPDEPSAGEGAAGPAAAASSREWLGQLEAMIRDISTQAAPVARQVGAKAAELAALAAVKAGPAAQRAAELTVDYGQRFADKAQSVAAELRAQDEGAVDTGTDTTMDPAAPDDAAAPETGGAADETPTGA